MKKIIILLFLIPSIAYSQPEISSTEESHSQIELKTKAFIENYLSAMNHPDWATKMLPYLRHPEFIDRHADYRKAFENLRFDIKHLMVNDNEGIVWITQSGLHVREFNDGVFKNIPATQNKVKWDEVWYYTVDESGKFGEKFELIHNNNQKMRALGIKCLPD